jgi:predicted porin
MNKKLIASAVSLAMAGGMSLANADVQVYGQIDLSLVATDSDVASTSGTTNIQKIAQDGQGYTDDINMESTNSNFGIKGEEDLGNGLSAFFKLEYETDLAGSNSSASGNALTGRDQYVGLNMEHFGKLTFGTTSTAYKDVSKQIDPFYMTPLQARAIGLQSNLHSGKGEEGQGRGTNMVRYDSPSLAGFGLTATYQFDSNKQDQNVVDCNADENCEDKDPYSVGLTYQGGNFYANASYIDTQRDNDTAAAEFAVRYDWNAFSFHGIYELDKGLITAQANNGLEQSSNSIAGAGSTGDFGRGAYAKDDGANIWSVGATYTIGNNLVAFDYGQRDSSNGKNGTDDGNTAIGGVYDDIQAYNVWRVGAWHSFSKRTRVYAGYANVDYDKKGEDDAWALGVRHNF